MDLNSQTFANTEFVANLSKGLICLDNSTFQKLACPRQFIYAGVLKQVPNTSRSPLVYGGAVHKALETYYLEGSNSKQDYINDLIDKVVAEYRIELDLCCDPKRNSQTLNAFLHSYFSWVRAFGEYLEPITLPDGKLAVEVSFSLPLCELLLPLYGKVTVMWEGRLDLIARDKRTGRVGVWDHKTTSMLGDTFIDQFTRSTQFSGYLWAGQQLSNIPDLDEVGINALCQKKENEFKHFIFRRPNWNSNEFIEGVHNTLMQFFTCHSHCNRAACTHKYGKCEFFDLCEMPPATRLNNLLNSGLFKTSTWSPLND